MHKAAENFLKQIADAMPVAGPIYKIRTLQTLDHKCVAHHRKLFPLLQYFVADDILDLRKDGPSGLVGGVFIVSRVLLSSYAKL